MKKILKVSLSIFVIIILFILITKVLFSSPVLHKSVRVNDYTYTLKSSGVIKKKYYILMCNFNYKDCFESSVGALSSVVFLDDLEHVEDILTENNALIIVVRNNTDIKNSLNKVSTGVKYSSTNSINGIKNDHYNSVDAYSTNIVVRHME